MSDESTKHWLRLMPTAGATEHGVKAKVRELVRGTRPRTCLETHLRCLNKRF